MSDENCFEQPEDTCENANTYRPRDLIEELESYKHTNRVELVDRDGDLHYINCPECDNHSVRSKKLYMCLHCGMHFSLYLEDGSRYIEINDQYGSVSGHGKEMVVLSFSGEFKTHSDDVVIIYPRHFINNEYNDKGILEIVREKYPNAQMKTQYRDLNRRTGKDAHSHEYYTQYSLTPVMTPVMQERIFNSDAQLDSLIESMASLIISKRHERNELKEEKKLTDFLESQDFYELMQTYRHSPIGTQDEVLESFDAIKKAIKGVVFPENPQYGTLTMPDSNTDLLDTKP